MEGVVNVALAPLVCRDGCGRISCDASFSIDCTKRLKIGILVNLRCVANF